MSDFQIDPVKYGQLWEKVDQLSVKVDKLEAGMEELLALANKGRGGFWAIPVCRSEHHRSGVGVHVCGSAVQHRQS